ncbi:MAG: YIP1 family protein [Actinomycetota bacterium]
MEAIRRALKLAAFERRTVTGLMYDSSATGDAVLIVAGVQAVLLAITFFRAGRFSLTDLVQSVILAIAGWLILAFSVWLMGTKLLKGSGEVESIVRTSGFGRLPLLLGAAGIEWLTWFGLFWHLAVLVVAVGVVFGLKQKDAIATVALGFGLVLVVQLLFRATFFAF